MASEEITEKLRVLKMMTVNKAGEQELPLTVSQLSNGGLTQISPHMIEYGGCVLLEFRKKCGFQFTKGTLMLAESVIQDKKCMTSFKNCIAKLDDKASATDHLLDDLYADMTSKIIHARVNEMVKADQQLQLEQSGKVIDSSQSLRDTLKAYSLSQNR